MPATARGSYQSSGSGERVPKNSAEIMREFSNGNPQDSAAIRSLVARRLVVRAAMGWIQKFDRHTGDTGPIINPSLIRRLANHYRLVFGKLFCATTERRLAHGPMARSDGPLSSRKPETIVPTLYFFPAGKGAELGRVRGLPYSQKKTLLQTEVGNWPKIIGQYGMDRQRGHYNETENGFGRGQHQHRPVRKRVRPSGTKYARPLSRSQDNGSHNWPADWPEGRSEGAHSRCPPAFGMCAASVRSSAGL